MQVELGPGTSPHPNTDVGIDPVHPIGAPAQTAQVARWVRYDYDNLVGGNQLRYVHDGEADHVYASHVLEHVPAGADRLTVFNEAWRVLRPGGCFTIVLPLMGWTPFGLVETYHAWADPTHVSHWWFPESLHYFTQGMADADYGIREWAPLGDKLPQSQVELQLHEPTGSSWWAVRGNWEGVARLVKP